MGIFKWKPFLIVSGLILGLFVLSIGGYALYLYHSVAKTASQVYKPLVISKSDPLTTPATASESTSNRSNSDGSNFTMSPNAINILLLGVDERKGDKGRSDTMIVASLNPDTKSMMLTSIPRDTRVNITGHSGYSKINAAYAYGMRH